MPNHPDLESILACPACKSRVKVEEIRVCCTNDACRLIYPVKNGIPVMLIEEAAKPS